MNEINDLRDYIRILEESNELRRVKVEVDCNLEIGAITRRLMDERGPAPLFENVKDHPGFKILGLPFGPSVPLHSRLSLALGLPKKMPALDLINYVRDKIANPIHPKVINDATCKSQVLKDDMVDLNYLPAPFIHSVDGGRYIGTWCIVITKDPESEWTNWGVYRVMVQDSRTVGVNFNKVAQHGGELLNSHSKKNSNAPYEVAIVLGADPFSLFAASTNAPRGLSEASVAGGLKGSPLELVKCETLDLEVPASSEVVIEGVIPPQELRLEGPMGEFTGYSSGGKRLAPIVKVKCVTLRNDPIITLANMGKPWDDAAVVLSIGYSANIKRILQDANIPVKDVFVFPFETSIISVERSDPDLAQKITKTLEASTARNSMVYTFIVGNDIDITNIEDVFWCLVTRLHPKNGYHAKQVNGGSPLIPHLTPEERKTKYSYRGVFDLTWPYDWTSDYLEEHCHVIDFEHAWPEEVRRKVVERWEEYGLASNKRIISN